MLQACERTKWQWSCLDKSLAVAVSGLRYFFVPYNIILPWLPMGRSAFVPSAMLFYLVVIATLYVMASCITVDDCPTGLKRDKFLTVFRHKCLKFEVSKMKTFQDAQSYCKTNGGNLVMVKSKAFNDFIHQKLQSTYGFQRSHFWIGLQFERLYRTYRWVDGTGLKYKNYKTSRFIGTSYCISINAGTGLWEDDKCVKTIDSWWRGEKRLRFICEYVPAEIKDGCPSTLKRDKYLKTYGNYCYRFEISTSKTFKDAQNHCKQDGGNLVTVKSNKINGFVKKSLHEFRLYTSRVWIGLRYNSFRQDYYWMDGTPLKYENWKSHGDNVDNECVVMDSGSGLWEDYRCNSHWFYRTERKKFVCQYSKVVPTTSTQPSRWSKIDNCPASLERDGNLNVFGDKCYRFVVNKLANFENAQNDCQRNGGNLAIVKSQEINNFIQDELNKVHGFIKTPFWIGLRYSHRYRKFHWIDGSLRRFNHFRKHVPNSPNECVAISPKDGLWDAMKCKKRSFFDNVNNRFVCEYNIVQTTTVPTTLSPTTTTTPNTSTVPTTSTTIKATTQMPTITTQPTTEMPTTTQPTTEMPTTTQPTTEMPTTTQSITEVPTTTQPTTEMPTTTQPTTERPTTTQPTTEMPTTTQSLTEVPTTTQPTTEMRTTTQPTTEMPSTTQPTTEMPTTTQPTTKGCPHIVCHLDCGLDGYVVSASTGCMECKCDNK